MADDRQTLTLKSTPGFTLFVMHTRTRLSVTVVLVLGVTTGAARAQHPAMPPGMTHEEHLAQLQKDADLKKRGTAAMGFDQDKTRHHFRLSRGGGAIEVTANDPDDTASRDQIRTHLQSIAGEFTAGDFGKPVATHAELPPGVRAMQQRRRALTFVYEELPAGARVRISGSDAKAVAAAHQFLRYQIREHATGDPVTVPR
jgi:hypothetical protein